MLAHAFKPAEPITGVLANVNGLDFAMVVHEEPQQRLRDISLAHTPILS